MQADINGSGIEQGAGDNVPVRQAFMNRLW